MDKEQVMILLRELSKRMTLEDSAIQIITQQHQDNLNLFQQLSDLLTTEESDAE